MEKQGENKPKQNVCPKKKKKRLQKDWGFHFIK
jgi:hypothetical protein